MDDPTLTEYRRVSALAILALLLGLAASAALIGGVLLALPVVGLGVGLLASAKINSRAGHLSGRALAQWGIFFSLLFGVAAVVHPLLFQEIVDRQGRSFAQSWLVLLATGNTRQALKYVDMRTKSQMAPRDDLGKPAANVDIEAEIFKAFQQDPMVHRLRAAGKQVRIHWEQTVSKPQSAGRKIWVGQIFSVTGNDSAGATPTDPQRPFYVRLHLQKMRATGSKPTVWTVGNWQLADTPSELASPPIP